MICSVQGLMPIVQESLMRGQRVRLTATGGSMWPFLRDGDLIEFAALEGVPRIGAILLARVSPDCYVIHRLSRIDGEGLYLLGDFQMEPEGPVARDAILGEALSVERGRRWRSLNRGFRRILGRIWLLLLSIRKPLIRALQSAAKVRRKLSRSRASG